MSNYYKKYHRTFYVLLLALLIVNSSLSIATVRYVSHFGSNEYPYTSWATSADSIMTAINVSVFGDTIYVANGVYQEQVVMIPGLALIGAGTDSCIVDCRNFPPQGLHAVEVADNCLIRGFYIRTSNNFDYGYGIYTIGQNGLITENKFSEANTGIRLWITNVQAYKNYFFNIRIGINVVNSTSLVRKNFIVLNVEGVYGIRIESISNNDTPIIDSNYVENVYDTGIYKFISSSPTIRNNIINVKYDNGIGIAQGGDVKIINNTILNAGSAGIDNFITSNVTVNNNYIMGNPSSYGIKVMPSSVVKNNVVTNTGTGIGKYGTTNPVVQYNNSWNNNINYDGITPDSTNLSVNPMVVNDDSTQGDLDFHLQMFSPLIDAGDPNILDKDSTRSDIGLYGGPYGESYIYVDLPPRIPVNLTANVDSLIELSWNRNTEADFGYYNVYRDTAFNFTVDSTKLIASITDTFYYDTFPSNVETLYYKLTAVDNQENESEPSEQVYVQLVSVKNEWVSVNNYILYQNYPNPFNPVTRIGYKLKERGYVKLYVYDIKGELVSVLVNETQEAGYYEVEFDTGSPMPDTGIRNLASGVYIYQIFVKGENSIPVFSDIKKMMYVK